MTAGRKTRGKSGLHEARVPGNARRGQPQGKRHREETAFCGPPQAVMVKRWGKSPPRDWQQDRHGKPHPEQCRIGASRGTGLSGYRRRDASAREARVGSWTPSARWGLEEWSSRGETPGQNPAYRPSARFAAGAGGASPPGSPRGYLDQSEGQSAVASLSSWPKYPGGAGAGPRFCLARRIPPAAPFSLLTPPGARLKGGLQGFTGEAHVSLWQEKRLWRSRRRSRSV